MDSQIKGHLEAIGARYLHLAATQPDTYIDTRLKEDEWRVGWMTEHEPAIRDLEDRVATGRIFAIRDMVAEAVNSGAAQWTDPVSPALRSMFPAAETLEDWMKQMLEMMDNVLMEEMTDGETS